MKTLPFDLTIARCKTLRAVQPHIFFKYQDVFSIKPSEQNPDGHQWRISHVRRVRKNYRQTVTIVHITAKDAVNGYIVVLCDPYAVQYVGQRSTSSLNETAKTYDAEPLELESFQLGTHPVL